MAGINTGNNAARMANLARQNAVRADANTVDGNEAMKHVAHTGGPKGTKKGDGDQKLKQSGEKLQLSNQALIDAREDMEAHQQDAHASVKDEAAQSQGKKSVSKEDSKKDNKIGKGKAGRAETGQKVHELETEDGEVYEVTAEQKTQTEKVLGRSPEQILEGMPSKSRAAAEATVKAQGEKKLNDLKEPTDPKIVAATENLDLDPAESLKDSARPAPIKDAKNEPPQLMEDPQMEQMAKEMAIKKAQSGETAEAMIA